jgi:hypothetical protein
MDELQAVRELFTESAPPRPEVTACVRARLLGPTSARRRIRLRAAVPAIAVATAASVVTAIAVQAPRTGPGTYQAGPGASPAARNILLTAARAVAGAAVPAEERYWQAKDVVANFITAGPAGRHYLIVEKVATQQWTTRMAPGQTYYFSRALNVQPATARDQAAWRLDGSPTTWNIYQEDSLADPHGYTNGFLRSITAGRGKLMGTAVVTTGTGKAFAFGHTLLSARELQALPASPDRLKALILRGSTAGAQSYIFQVTPSLLTMPVTPAVRAALYRMLAGLPGIHSLGQVTDPAGQTGAAVALTGHFRHCGVYWQVPAADHASYRFSSCTVQQRLIIDPHTGLPLAQELRYLKLLASQTWSAPGGMFSYQLFGSAQWTNATLPHLSN